VISVGAQFPQDPQPWEAIALVLHSLNEDRKAACRDIKIKAAALLDKRMRSMGIPSWH